MLGLGAKTHYVLYASTVVPAAIEQDEFLGNWELGNVALKVPGLALPVRRSAKCHYPRFPGAQVFNDALDTAVFARSIAPLKKYQDLVTAADKVALKLDQLNLQFVKLVVIVLARDGLYRFLGNLCAYFFITLFVVFLAHDDAWWI